MANLIKKPHHRTLNSKKLTRFAQTNQKIQKGPDVRQQIRDHFASNAPNNADDEDDRSFLGAKKLRMEKEAKIREAMEMREALKRKAIMDALILRRMQLRRQLRD